MATLFYEASPSGVKEAIPAFPIELLTNLTGGGKTFTNLSIDLKFAKIANSAGGTANFVKCLAWALIDYFKTKSRF